MRMHNSALSDNAAYGRMQIQSDVASSATARRVRAANLVLAPGEAWTANPVFDVTDAQEIILYDNRGNVMGAYRITAGALAESADGNDFKPFMAGGEAVGLAGVSAFRLSGNRKEVTLNLKIAIQYRNKNYENAVTGGLYLCRN